MIDLEQTVSSVKPESSLLMSYCASLSFFERDLLPYLQQAGAGMDDDHLRTTRLADVITLWSLLNEESKCMQVATREKIDTLSEVLSFETTVQAKKEKAKSEAHDFFRLAALALKSTKNQADVAISERSLLGTAAVPIELALTMNRGGQILTALVTNRSA